MLKSFLRSNKTARRLKAYLDFMIEGRHSKIRVFRALFKENHNLILFDVGANVGQFALDMMNADFKGEIHSFEPVSEFFFKLEQNSKRYKNWKVWNFALGQRHAMSEIFVSANDGLSSSLLAMKDLHAVNFPMSAAIRKELICIRTLADFLDENTQITGPIFLKIDVQGFEMEVLKGLKDRISEIIYIYLEASTSPLYEGESDLHQLMNWLYHQNFILIQFFDGIRDKQGSLLQVDMLFKRNI